MVSMDLALYLEQNNIGKVGQNIFVAGMPDKPNVCLTLFETSGYGMELNNPLERPQISVIVRGTNYAEAYELINAVINTLHTISNKTINGHYYLLVRVVNNPQVYDKDDYGRVYFSVEFDVLKERG